MFGSIFRILLETAYQRLLGSGIRPSVQRVAIMNYLLEHHTHPTIEEVYNYVKQEIPTVSKTTVYNTLRMFSECNVATMITIDDHRVCYDGNTNPHIHFFCKKCEKVFDFENIELPEYKGIIGKGFQIDDMQLYYKGICPQCLEYQEDKINHSSTNCRNN